MTKNSKGSQNPGGAGSEDQSRLINSKDQGCLPFESRCSKNKYQKRRPFHPTGVAKPEKPPVQPKHSQPPLMCPITTELNGTHDRNMWGSKFATNKTAPKELDIDRGCAFRCAAPGVGERAV
jgi:hypothetical protein